MDIRDKIIVKQRELMELYIKYLSDFTKHFGIPNFWEKEFDGKLHEIASLEKELQEQKLQTAEEVLRKHGALYRNRDGSYETNARIFVSELVKAMKGYASQFQKPTKEITNKEIEKAAYDYAVHHSSAPDKETPDWIMADFKAGIEWIKKLLISYGEYVKECSDDCSIIISVNNFLNKRVGN